MAGVAKHELRAAGLRLGDPRRDAIRLLGKDQRTDIGCFMGRVANLERSNAGSEPTASKPMCSLRQERRLLVPCFSTSHSPGPPSFSPELSTSRWIGPPVARGCAGSSRRLGSPAEGGEVRHRQVEAEQLEDRADQPLGLAQRQTEHSAQGQGCRDRQVRVVRAGPPGVVRGAAFQAAMASSVNHTVKLPRCRSASL